MDKRSTPGYRILTTRASSKRTQAIAQQRETRLATLQMRVFFSKPVRRTNTRFSNRRVKINSNRETLTRTFFSWRFFREFSRRESILICTAKHVRPSVLSRFLHILLLKYTKRQRGEARSIYTWRNSGLKNSQETRHPGGGKPPENSCL